MRSFKTYFIIFVSTLSLLNCKKYPEGGYERRGPKLILGNWKLSLYEVNGIDSTDLINYNGNDNYKNNSFLKHHNRDKEIIIQSKGSSASKLYFIDKNRKIEFYTNDSALFECLSGYCYRNYFLPEGDYYNAWQIIKLNKNELKLKCCLKNTYVINFKRQ